MIAIARAMSRLLAVRRASVAFALAALMLIALAFRPAQAAVSGTLTIVGSDTLSTLVLRWIDAFRAQHRDALIQLQTPGSASAPIALLEGAADIGAMSRAMNTQELTAFHDRFGYEPTAIIVARDAIVVFVHPDNPLTAITRSQLDA
ncbi:MAG: substrate-binding domain-containing protein, partial [Rhodanobacteraceae bacterium]